MNLVFFIFFAIVIITPNIINAKILKYDNYTCYGSCCRRAFKPSNYSDVLIEYSINFTVDEVVLTIWLENAKQSEPKLYSFTTNKTATSQSWEFSARDDFEYCFNAIKYGSNDHLFNY
ncbi:uncharacterized protein LOC122853696 [Aphidius gifuensis]|uniref:uncharacterized protein LOC122853696 n=1 Tax=Aphidius gifuensis TaxID=684658 RepID=UPI001CDB5F38|nr:uncharacterized protein LOC122853696 [Aphidius gifuensis]